MAGGVAGEVEDADLAIFDAGADWLVRRGDGRTAPKAGINAGSSACSRNVTGAGPLAQDLFNELMGIQYGTRPDPFGWIREVKLAHTGSASAASG